MWISLSIAAPERFVGAVRGVVYVLDGIVTETGSPGRRGGRDRPAGSLPG
jgi:hypothetical protein